MSKVITTTKIAYTFVLDEKDFNKLKNLFQNPIYDDASEEEEEFREKMYVIMDKAARVNASKPLRKRKDINKMNSDILSEDDIPF